MRLCFISVLLLSSVPSLLAAQETPAAPVPAQIEDGNVIRSRNELNRVQALVDSGVLPRARLLQAQDAVGDAQDDSAIRTLLYKQDISVEEAEQLVSMTTHRVSRRQGIVDAKTKLIQAGILAKDEIAGDLSALAQAQSQKNWADSRLETAHELSELVKTEQEAMRQMELAGKGHALGLVERFIGSNRFDLSQFPMIQRAFETRFAHPLPVSAMGETEVHRSLGFDHRNRVDVALQPEMPEGRWLRNFLTAHNIPFFAFRSAVAHQATGAHIHIGPPSLHFYAQSAPKVRTGLGE